MIYLIIRGVYHIIPVFTTYNTNLKAYGLPVIFDNSVLSHVEGDHLRENKRMDIKESPVTTQRFFQ